MPLSVGDRLGHYAVVSLLGQGGMGEVYRAKDLKLGREVAIKVVPVAFASDADRMARFAREAQVLASLNHPNIGAIHGVEGRALVMELVEGATLAERIAQGALPLEEAIPVATQIAEALEYAHEKSVVHRDLKPANIKITPEGRVKVLDFGLAKALSSPAAASPDYGVSATLTMGATEVGMILGTAPYMAPEQARAKPADKRSDIWAFGVVLYEMLTGKRLYRGETSSDILAAVIAQEPALDNLPPEVRPVIEKCLRKEPRRRWQSIGDVRLALEEPVAAAPETAPRRPVFAWVIAAIFAAFTAFALWAPWHTAVPPSHPLARLSVDLGPEAVVGANITAAISPDGTRLVYPGRSQDGKTMLFTRVLDQTKPSVLVGTEDATEPFFSPDGQWIGFFADNKMQKISVQGGAPVVLAGTSNARGASWGDDGNIVAELVNTEGLMRIPANGGQAQQLAPLRTGDATLRWPQVLPGSQTILFTASDTISAFDEARIDVLSLKTNQRKTVWRGGYFGRYLPANSSSGYLVYIHQGTLFAGLFDLNRLEIQGTPVPLLDDVASETTTGGGQFDIASVSGTLVYHAGKARARSWPVLWLDRSNKTQPLLSKPGTYYTPSISPDGRLLAIGLESGKDLDTWIYDIQRQSMSRLTYTALGGIFPVWMPDGKHIIFSSRSSDGRAIKWIRSDGAADVQTLLQGEHGETRATGSLVDHALGDIEPYSVSSDGRRLAYSETSPDTGQDLWTLTLDLSDPEHPKPGKPEPFLRTPANERDPALSPDGRWIAYVSTESGIPELYVRPFPGPGGKWQISTGGGKFPKWSRAGHSLYYQTPRNDGIMEVDYTVSSDAFSASKPHVAASAGIFDAIGSVNWDVAPNDRQFVIFPLPEEPADKTSIHVTFLLNFGDELRRKVPTVK